MGMLITWFFLDQKTILIHFRWLWSYLGILSFWNFLLEKDVWKISRARLATRVCVFLSNKPVSSGHFVMNTVRVSTVIWSTRVIFDVKIRIWDFFGWFSDTMKMGKRSPIVKGNTLQWVIMHILSHLYYLKDFFHGVRVSCQRTENSCKYFWDLIVLQCVRVQVQEIEEV